MPRRRGLKMALGCAVVVLAVVAGFLLLRYFNVDAVRAITVQRLEALTGRDVEIAGDFDLVPSLAPTVAAEGIVLANAPWGSEPAMLRAERIEVELQTVPLVLRGDVVIDRLVLDGADLLLETDAGGRANWDFGGAPEPEVPEERRAFLLSEVSIRDGEVTWRDLGTGRTETVRIDNLGWRADAVTDELAVTGTGRYRSRPLAVSGVLGPLAVLLEGDAPYPVTLQGSLGGLRAEVEGRVGVPSPLEGGTRLEVTLAGDRLASLGDLVGTDLPPLGAFEVTGLVASNDAGGLAAERLRATVGDGEPVVLTAEGQIDGLLAGEGIRLEVAAEGPAVSALGDLVGTGLPAAGPFAVRGELTGSVEALTLAGLTGTLGREGAPLVRLTGGTVVELLEGEGIDLRLQAQGPAFAALGDLIDMEPPRLGPYTFEGRLTGSADALALTGLAGTVGTEESTLVRLTEGSVDDVLAIEGVQVRFEAEGDDLEPLAGYAGIGMASFGPFLAEGTVVGGDEALALRDFTATAGGEAARVEVAGAIQRLLAAGGLDLAVTVEGTTLAALSPLAGANLPDSAPYRVAGRVTGSPAELRINDLQATLAESTLGGSLSVLRPAGGPPRIEGELTADRLDLDRLAGLAGAAAAAEEDGAPPPEERPAAAAEDGAAEEAAPLPLDALNAVEATLALRAEELTLNGATFRNASAEVTLDDGRLGVRDLVLRVAGGRVAGDLAVDAGQPAAEMVVRLNARNIEVGELLADLGAAEGVAGEVDIDLSIDSTGRSLDQLLAELEGGATLVAEEGRIPDERLNLLTPDLDILRALPPFWRRDEAEGVRVNCLVGEFDIQDGLARTEALLDTRRMTLLGRGTVNLPTEAIDLRLRPVPKSRKLSTAAVPVDIEGTLTEPEVNPDVGATAAGAIGGFLGGLLVPLNQIAALFGEETADACADALRQARGRVGDRGGTDQQP